MSKIRPDTKHQEYVAMEAQWSRARDTYAGTDAVKGKKETYLPKLDVHRRGTDGDARYEAYLRRAYFFNAVRRTVIGLSGLIHQSEPDVKAPESAEAWLEDVTMTGVSAQLQSLLSTQEVVLVGRAGLLVDMTLGEDPRPYWVPVSAENIFNWRVAYRDGNPYLSLVVIRECVQAPVPDDPFATEETERFRVLSLTPEGYYMQTIWTKMEKTGEWKISEAILPERLGAPLTFIPFVFIGPTSGAPKVEAPPVIDLVDLNISHYQTTANLEHGLGYLGAPSLVLIGAVNSKGKPIEYGSSAAITLPVGGDAKILQANGDMMGALERAEERKRKLLSVLGSKLLEDQASTAETATAVAMRHSGEHASLRTVAQSVERAFEWALKVSVWWESTGVSATVEETEAAFKLNKDFFSTTLTSADIQALIMAMQSDAISFETFWHEYTEGGHGRPGVTAEEEQAAIAAQGGPETMPNSVIVGNPYEVKQLRGEWVVTKKGTDEIVPGGKHGKDRAKAMKHFAALEASYHKEQK